MGKLFGTDGIRGIANKDLTPELAYNIARAGAFFFLESGYSGSAFVIGKDTRLSGDMLEGALLAGFTSAGIDVVKAGVITTPGVACLIKQLKGLGGVMISASHNSFEDNGIKFFDSLGFKLSDAGEDSIEDVYFNSLSQLPYPVGGNVGVEKNLPDTGELYLSNLRETVTTSLSGLKVVLDCANGAAYQLAPKLFSSLGAHVEVIHAEPNGININVDCGSTCPETVAKAVLQRGADVGLAFDGDADRLIAVDEKGRIVDGDAILFMLALQMKEEGKLQEDTLVATIMSNMGLEVAAKEAGIKVKRTKVGDRYVLEMMRSRNYKLGGEQSGHVIFLDHSTTGDGILTALQVLNIMQRKNVPLSTLSNAVTPFPQVLKNCAVNKEGWDKNKKISDAMKEAEERLQDTGRIIVRPSGTENLIRVMVEAQDKDLMNTIAEDLCKVIIEEQGKI